MTTSIFKKFVLPPVLLSTGIFATLTLPLALLGSKSVAIQLQEEPVFHGKLRDVATPYLGLASLLSLGTGVASVTVAGWQQSSRKSAQVEQQLSGLQKSLQEKEEQLEQLKLSESRLATVGLNSFLEGEVSQISNTASETTTTAIQPVVITTPVQAVEPLIVIAHKAEPSLTVQAAIAQFPLAQNYLAYTQAIPTQNQQDSRDSQPESAPDMPSTEELQDQLQQIMAQMENLHKALQINTIVKSEQEVSASASMLASHF
ncbi:hypothetical protein [Gloeocapsopsis dulcis]|uniref:Uncharacterized protein n=1 Tax=Gloeocapsopsis dulcis AAB1 = 1H9 TaxID=1433147 RepID=A0A6N8FSP3_9CHRO|nr:hypothetical protein [Gloeocapsopsis dulcis]MUL35774.1 hypothetical protein [Gloeocapsopsis dulcis AAB1 = 1H9]WNN90941.1 hypothetical protein P0S91_07665 [Gloeocapsopsis dulcis]